MIALSVWLVPSRTAWKNAFNTYEKDSGKKGIV
jgi:hypothetical protein